MKKLFLNHSIVELHQLMINNELLREDVITEFEAMVNQYEQKVHAWAYYDINYLRNSIFKGNDAFRKELLGSMLAGLPVGVNDNFNIKMYPTEMGSQIWKGFTPGNNARVVDILVQEGGLIAGKTVTTEFAVHELNETINPHDFMRTPGASSSGSAVAVAAGMVPYALGTQAAGCLARPASYCGIWGMKPSFGLIPRTGVLKTTDTLDTVGFVAAHGKSLRPILDAIRVKGPNYPFVYKLIDRKKTSTKHKGSSLRIGFIKTHVWDNAEAYVKEEFQNLLNELTGLKEIELQEMQWDNVISDAHNVHSILYNKSIAYYFQNEKRIVESISHIMKNLIEVGNEITPEQYKYALSMQTNIGKAVEKSLEPFDVVFSLGTSSDAPLRGSKERPDPSSIWTLAHIPSVFVPMFRSPQGLPFGIQIISKRFNDYLLLSIVEDFIDQGVFPSGSMNIENPLFFE